MVRRFEVATIWGGIASGDVSNFCGRFGTFCVVRYGISLRRCETHGIAVARGVSYSYGRFFWGVDVWGDIRRLGFAKYTPRKMQKKSGSAAFGILTAAAFGGLICREIRRSAAGPRRAEAFAPAFISSDPGGVSWVFGHVFSGFIPSGPGGGFTFWGMFFVFFLSSFFFRFWMGIRAVSGVFYGSARGLDPCFSMVRRFEVVAIWGGITSDAVPNFCERFGTFCAS